MNNHLIGVVGLSHLGVTASIGLASLGFQILGVDPDQETVRHLRQGDCIVQNGTRHRWRNPLPEPCLMAFISIGGKRG